ncbi:hypothetical protein PZ938_02990 [Luteipulveratus sp. YIM 133132]|uniref:hypothetical protein n=1 Tax=Luteipulveratus flavus TaxID=3031728 RepID=UPI0023B01191|nr:hypothetical protein [Luteipulveratus sp. YIM 133132]MDE9364558.1 hypothetical protein [Luteipulveratus sp. YIM 133132]
MSRDDLNPYAVTVRLLDGAVREHECARSVVYDTDSGELRVEHHRLTTPAEREPNNGRAVYSPPGLSTSGLGPKSDLVPDTVADIVIVYAAGQWVSFESHEREATP